MAEEITSQLPYSVKLESTAKGVRIHVHVYSTNMSDVANEAIQLYLACDAKLKTANIPVAPFEIKKVDTI